MSTSFEDLYHKYKFICEIKEYKSSGHICLYVANINPIFIKKNIDEITTYIFLAQNKALEISQKFNKERYCSHIYLESVTPQNFNLPIFKKLSRMINNNSGDKEVLDRCYIYGTSKFIKRMFNIVKVFLLPTTRKKIIFVNNS